MQNISLINLSYSLLPLIIVGYFYYKYTGNKSEILYSTFRMISQLLIIGYFLVYIFENKNYVLGLGILLFMLLVSSIIIMRNTKDKSYKHYSIILFSSFFSSLINLILVLYFVLELKSYEPSIIIPIAGMIFANTMNSISICIERFEKEIQTSSFIKARESSFKASMIPQINSLLAVGLVSLPGMMTGQILSGIDPLIAVRYQIMIMIMLLSTAGLSKIIYFTLINKLNPFTKH
ncbi:MAG: ABC transporter permease [Campylobacteraceae bacterium]|nr:ABC transporter permease [Campylobacteraceae bacterium]